MTTPFSFGITFTDFYGTRQSTSATSNISHDPFYNSVLYTRENSFYQTSERWMLKWDSTYKLLQLFYFAGDIQGTCTTYVSTSLNIIASDSSFQFSSDDEFHKAAPDLISSLQTGTLRKRGILSSFWYVKDVDQAGKFQNGCFITSNSNGISGNITLGEFGMTSLSFHNGENKSSAYQQTIWNIDMNKCFVCNVYNQANHQNDEEKQHKLKHQDEIQTREDMISKLQREIEQLKQQ